MMKRIILLSLVALVAIALSAQNVFMKPSQTYAKYIGVASDVIDAAENLDKIFVVNKDYWYHYYATVDIDTNTDASDNTLSCLWEGSFDNTNWITLDDVTFYVSDDTVIYFSDTTGITESTSTSIASYVIYDTTEAYIITDTIASFNVWCYDSLIYDDTLHVPQITNDKDVAQTALERTVSAQTITTTNTVTPGGVMYQYLRFRLTGDAAGSEAELQSIDLKIVRAQ
jgi:uncharacterized protein YneR